MKRTLKLAGFCALSLLVMLLTTSPERLPSVVLVVPFLLVFASLLLIAVAILRRHGVSGASAVRLAAFAAMLPTLLLVFQSLGQLTLRDILTMLVIFCVAYFYMARVVHTMGP